ncbi:MAG TPA: DHHA1 domain-containing protein, partial [Bdellovibrionota bacterium]|nr:DHHA1 domain-containing protein [Bdellovibrionota bacterium]
LATGAVALFDEKYGAEVRVISLGDYSKELCGGTHLERTGEIGLFKIIKESSVAAGIRRIDAVTGYRALRYVQDADQKLKGMASLLGVPAEDVGDRVEQVLQRQKELEKELRKKSSGPAQSAGKKIEPRITEVKGIRIATAEIDGADHKELRELADRYLEELKSGVVALATKVEGKALIVVKVSKDLSGQYPAGKLIQSAAALLGGTGGGRPEMAQAGGPRVEGIPEALIKIQDAI